MILFKLINLFDTVNGNTSTCSFGGKTHCKEKLKLQ